MTITWFGHACFRLETAAGSVVLDPYTDVPGYPPLHVAADHVLCSHGHGDHSYLPAVTLPDTERPWAFTVDTLPTWHDDKGGALRGKNTVHILRAEGKTAVHLGDLGHLLTPAQLAPLRGCDVLMIPVGGFFTIDAAAARQVVADIGPRVVLPMHYRRGVCGYEVIGEVEPFLARFAPEEVHRLDTSELTLTDDLRGVYVPRYPV